MEAQTNNRYKNPIHSKVFGDHASAMDIYNTLLARGYTSEEIDVIMSAESRRRHFINPVKLSRNYIIKISAKGSTTGIIVGLIAAILFSIIAQGFRIGIMEITAICLIGSGAGAISGGVIGAFYGANTYTTRSKAYRSEITRKNMYKQIHTIQEKARGAQGRNANGIEFS